MRIALGLALGVTLTVLACSGDDSSSGSSQSGVPPNPCTEPCKTGTECYQQPTPGCNGTWYCWTDQKWYCQPQDAGGPGGPPPDGAFMEEESPVTMPDASISDAPRGG